MSFKSSRNKISRCRIGRFPLLLGLCLALLVGCSKEPDGPARYSVSGTVTYDGKPVPKGFIMFTPDASQDNTGPASGAPIVDGKYQTEPGKGMIGGPHRVEITGTDGIPYTEEGEEVPDGKDLFPKFQATVDLPQSDATEQNFEVPVSNE